MSNFFHTIFYIPIESGLMFFYNLTVHNLGLSIILLTLVIRLLLIPLTLPSLRSAKKMKEIKGEVDAVKKKHKGNPKKLQEEQLQLYKKHGINPAIGCLPLLIQLPILFFLYRVLLDVLNSQAVNAQFLFFNLKEPDQYFVLPVLAAVSQFILSFMMSPDSQEKKDKNKDKEKKGENFADSLSSALQTQNLYIMPLLWFFLLLKMPSGIGVYWVSSTIFGFFQQLIFIGPGRLEKFFKKK